MNAGPETGDDGETVDPETAADREPDDPAGEHGSPGLDRPTDGRGSHGQIVTRGERKPAVTRRDESVDDEETPPGVLSPSEPPEPQPIDAENAAFVLLGVVFVIGFVLVAVAGL